MKFDPKLVDDWVAIWNNYNLDQVPILFLNEPNVTYFSSEKEGVVLGFDAVIEHHKEFGFIEGGKKSPNRLWLENVHIAEFEDSVVVTGIWFFNRGGSPETQKGAVGVRLRREGGVI